MADPNGPPRRVSMTYLLGFSDKPFKGPRPPPPPLQPKRPSQLAEMVTTPGGIIEWTASDGRKGRLTGTGKSRLTAAALAKVPSEKRSTHEALAAKSASKHSAPDKTKNDVGNTEAKNGSKHSGSKKAASKIDDAGVTLKLDVADSIKGKDGKKDDTIGVPPATGAPVEVAPQEVVAAPVVEEKKADDSQSWTKEQDEKLMQLKTHNPTMQWLKVAEEVGKSVDECKHRFGEIKRDNAKKEGAAGGGKKGKKEKDKGNKTVESKTQAPADTGGGDADSFHGLWGTGFGDDTNNAVENKAQAPAATGGGDTDLFHGFAGVSLGDGTKNWDFDKKEVSGFKPASVHASGGAGGWGNVGDATACANTGGNGAGWDDIPGATGGADTSGNLAWDKDNNWCSNDQADTGAANAVTSNACNNPGEGDLSNKWFTSIKPASASHSNKAPPNIPSKAPSKPPSKAPSQSRPQGKDEVKPPEPVEPVPARPTTIELRPDDTFSADDLRQVARILQQDCAMVWSRVSWRFKDKTGRTLHPDVFEKKITGQIEGKGSERGGRKK